MPPKQKKIPRNDKDLPESIQDSQDDTSTTSVSTNGKNPDTQDDASTTSNISNVSAEAKTADISEAHISSHIREQANNISNVSAKVKTADTSKDRISSHIREQARAAAELIPYCSDDLLNSNLPLKNFREQMEQIAGVPGLGLSCRYVAENLDILTLHRFTNGTNSTLKKKNFSSII